MWTLIRRIRTAAAVLFLPGNRMPVTQRDLDELRLEWSQWQMTFTGTLEKLNAWYARQAKREKRELERHTSGDPHASNGTSAIPTDRRARKLALSRRVIAGGIMPASPIADDSPEDEDDEP